MVLLGEDILKRLSLCEYMGVGRSSGLVTFLLTDVEGSTKLWEDHADVMSVALARHDEIVGATVSENRGVLVKSKGEGDSTFSVFEHPTDGVAASIAAQRALAVEPWPDGVAIRVRMALHTGEAEMRDGDYYGPTVNRCARLRGIAHGGQTICSLATQEHVADHLADDLILRDLGSHGLRDLARAERVYQVSSANNDEEFPPLRSLTSFRTNLPTQRTSLVGRENEVLTVRKLLADDRLVTLTGVGGCGKTRLALQVAAEELETFPDGVFFCDLSPISDPELVASQVASAVGMPLGGLTPSTRPVRDDLLDYLAYKHALVVVDNCEHLVDACALVVDAILDRCPDVRIIATSREALEVDGERPHTVPSLDVPDEGDATYSEAVHLFCVRAGAIKENFVLDDGNAEHIAEICRRLDGIPLAIELAAAQIAVMSPHQIEQRLSDRFRLLSGGRLRVQRQQTLAGALDWSYDLLTEPERTMLRRLAVFPGSFTIEQTEAIAMRGLSGSAVTFLGSLVAKSLVVTVELQERDHRYGLLETVRLYAEQKLLEAGESDDYRARHRDYFLDWMESFDEASVLNSATWETILAEMHNLRAAIVWSHREGRLDVLARIVPLGIVPWMVQLDDLDRLLSEGLQATNLTRDQRVRALSARAWTATLRLDFDTWFACCDEGMRLAEDRPGLWESMLCGLMSLYWGAQSFFGADDEVAARVEPLARRAMDMAGSPSARLFASFWAGFAFAFLRDLDRCVEVLTAGLAGDLEPSDRGGAAISLSQLALVHHLRGDHQDALAAAQRAADDAVGLGGMEASWRVTWSAPLGLALASVGRGAEGLAYMREITSWSDLKAFPGALPGVLIKIAAIIALRSDHERAVRVLGAASAGLSAPLELLFLERYRAELQAAVPEPTFSRLWNEGLQMSNEEILALALQDPDE